MDSHHSSNNENIHIVDSDDGSEVNRSTNVRVSDRKELVRISVWRSYNRTKLRTHVQGLLNRAKKICIETDPIAGTYIYCCLFGMLLKANAWNKKHLSFQFRSNVFIFLSFNSTILCQ